MSHPTEVLVASGVCFSPAVQCLPGVQRSCVTIRSPCVDLEIDHLDEPSSFDVLNNEIACASLARAIFGVAPELPLFRFPPRTMAAVKCPQRSSCSSDLRHPDLLVEALRQSCPADLQFRSAPNVNWEWSVEGVCRDSSAGPDIFDPISTYMLLAEQKCAHEAADSTRALLLERLRSLAISDHRKCAEVICNMVAQNRFVTSKCYTCVSPALRFGGSVAREVEAFLAEEEGHDQLMELTVRSLSGGNSHREHVIDSIKASLACLYHAASTDEFCLAVILSLFEGSAFGDRDPLSKVLESAGFGHAARGLDIHFNINKEGKHGIVGLKILDSSIPLCFKRVEFATRLLELACRFQSDAAASFLSSL